MLARERAEHLIGGDAAAVEASEHVEEYPLLWLCPALALAQPSPSSILASPLNSNTKGRKIVAAVAEALEEEEEKRLARSLAARSDGVMPLSFSSTD